MSIRWYDKDHLPQAPSAAELLGTLPLPILESPLQFWSHHPKSNYLVDLHVFANGLVECPDYRGQAGCFTGRARLIHQLAPTIKAAMTGRATGSIKNGMKALRAWWRLFDDVESGTQLGLAALARVEDVRQITAVHIEAARRGGVTGDKLTWFLSVVNVTLKTLGAPTLYWDSMDRPPATRKLPPEEQIRALRIGLKQEWEMIRRRFSLTDRVREGDFVPATSEETELLLRWQFFSTKQQEFNVPLPTSEQLRGEIEPQRFVSTKRFTLHSSRTIAFPDLWEADTAFHMCLANTGWNPAVLHDLDARSEASFLRDHPYDNARYLLVGTKARAGGKEQPVSGLWKTPWGPGPIIRLWLEKVAPLRQQLESLLARERQIYDSMLREGAQGAALVKQHHRTQRLEAGCRSVWLYVGRSGDIEWLCGERARIHRVDNCPVGYLAALIYKLNDGHALCGKAPIENVRASDFRDIFALYVWRQSGGNIIALMRLLNHARLRTTQGYVDNNILNAERDVQARRFLENLFGELAAGRLDIAILAHLQRYGTVTHDMEQRLREYRALHRSRMGIACRDPLVPPDHMRSAVRANRWCTAQRCLLCSHNAIILPESLSGITMRVEELLVIQKSVSSEAWLLSDWPQELYNGLEALVLFPADEVRALRAYWQQELLSGTHKVPGLRVMQE